MAEVELLSHGERKFLLRGSLWIEKAFRRGPGPHTGAWGGHRQGPSPGGVLLGQTA